MCARTWVHVDEDNDVRDILNHIQLLITNAGRDLQSLCDMESSEQDRVTYDTLQEIWLLKPDMILFLRLLPKLVRAFGVVPSADEILARYIESLVDNLQFLLNYKADFVAPVKEKLEVFKGNLKILKDELDEDMADCISFTLIDLLQSIHHAKSDIRSYVGGLKLLHPTIEFTREVDVFAAGFVHFTLEAPMSKLNSRSYLPIYNDRVQKLQISLRLLLVYILCCDIHNESLTIFDLVVNEFWSFISSLDNRETNEDLGKEFDLAISRLVQKMEPMASKILKGTIEKQKPALPFSQIDSLG
ncbi:uncharacterized protein LOC107818075 isoform X2 [Nicotiana tabacum]|uniref:uncharacterized protein LOC107818075 isoform X2 n=1 Tax=Nicotiana tabacum TaxID=4097 RepID=UPI003F4EA5B6